jgi:RNase adaptor protein for sRNA GlmZ degradation
MAGVEPEDCARKVAGMISTSVQDRNVMLEEYLQLLHSMAFELERAMSAISQNSIKALEESLANQEAFSTRLLELADNLSVRSEQNSRSHPIAGDESLIREVKDAADTLQSLNRRYAALLKFSSQSVAMMVSLFSSYQGKIQEDSGPRLKLQTWSCRA